MTGMTRDDWYGFGWQEMIGMTGITRMTRDDWDKKGGLG